MKHGGNIYKVATKLECNADEIIDFSSNLNLYQPETQITLDAKHIARYADTSYSSLKKIIATNYNLRSSQIALFNGATSAIYQLLASLKQKNVFLYAPLFSEYENAAIKSKKNIYKINRIGEIDAKPLEKSIVVLVNPSTPEGAYQEDIKELFEQWVELECTIILDESFLEFEELESMREKINEYKKLYIIQSFSKFYSCAGVRIGAIFSNKKNIKKLPTQPWNISSLDASFLESRLGDEAFKTQTLTLHKQQKAQLQTILEESKLFDEIVESNANFILVRSKDGEAIYKHLLKNKILVRTCGSFDYLSNDWLRFAVKDEASQSLLKQVLQYLIK